MVYKIDEILIFVAAVLFLAWFSVTVPVKQRGLQYSLSGKLEEARKELEIAYERNPDDAVIIESLSKIYITLGRFDKAIELASKLPHNTETSKLMTELYVQSGRVIDAISYLESNLKNSSSDAESLKTVIKLKTWINDMDGAARSIELYLSYKKDSEYAFRVFDIYVWIGDVAHAQSAAFRMEQYPDCTIPMLRSLRTFYLSIRDADGALRLAVRISKINEATEHDYLICAQIIDWTNAPISFAHDLEDTIFHSGGPIIAQRYLASVILKRGEQEQFAELMEKIAGYTNSQEDWNNAAYAYGNTANREKIYRIFKNHVNPQKLDNAAIQFFGETLVQQEKKTEASSLADKITADVTSDVDKLLSAATLYNRTGEQQKFESTLLRIIEESSDNISARVMLAAFYNDAGRFEEGSRLLKNVSLNTADTGVLREILRSEYGQILKNGKPSEYLEKNADIIEEQIVKTAVNSDDVQFVKAQIEILIALDKHDAALSIIESRDYYDVILAANIAETLAKSQNIDKAQLIAKKYILSRKIPDESLEYVAWVLYLCGLYEDSLFVYEKAIALFPLKKDLLFAASDTAYVLKNREKQYEYSHRAALCGTAEDWIRAAETRVLWADFTGEFDILNEARKQYPLDDRLKIRYMIACVREKKEKEALQLYAELKDRMNTENIDILKQLGAAFLQWGRYTDAETCYRNILNIVPDDAESIFFLAGILRSLEKTVEAEQFYGRYVQLKNYEPRAWYEYGAIRMTLGKDYTDSLEKAVTLAGARDDVESLTLKASALSLLGRNIEARRIYEILLASENSSADLAADYIDILARQGENTEEIIEKYITLYPAHRRLARQKIIFTVSDALKKSEKTILRKNLGALSSMVYSGDSEAVWILTEVYFVLGMQREALNLIEKSVDVPVWIRIRAAESYAQSGFIRKSIALLDEILSESQDVNTNSSAAYIYLLCGDYIKAEKIYKTLIAKNEGTESVFEGLIGLYLTRNRINQASEYLSVALGKFPDSKRFWNLNVQILYGKSRFKDIVEYADSLPGFDTMEFTSVLNIAESFQMQNRNTEAQKILLNMGISEKTRKYLNENNGESVIRYSAYVHYAAGLYNEAAGLYLCLKDFDSEENLIAVISCYENLGKKREQFEYLLKAARKYGEKYYIAAYDIAYAEKFDESSPVLKEGYKKFPESVSLNARIARMYFEAKDILLLKQRKDHFISVFLKATDNEIEDIYMAADSFFAAGLNESAALLCRYILEHKPENTQAMRTIAAIMSQSGRDSDAVILYEEFLRMHPEDGWAWYDYVSVLRRTGKNFESAAYQAEIQLRKYGSSSDSARGYLFLWTKNHSEAFRIFERRLNDSDSSAYAEYADALVYTGTFTKASDICREGLQKFPDNMKLVRINALCELRLGHRENALRTLRKMYDNYPKDPEIAAELAYAEELNGNWQYAKKLYFTASQLLRQGANR